MKLLLILLILILFLLIIYYYVKRNKNKKEKVIIIYCEMYPNKIAEVNVTYGLYSEYEKGRPYNKHNLSLSAAKELYEECKGSINAGYMYWKNSPIK